MRDLLTGLREAWGGAVALLRGLDGADWDRPTPCEGWAVRDVAAHLGHVEGIAHGYPQPPTPETFDPSAFGGFHAFTEEGVAARRPLPVGDVLGEVVTAAEATLAQVGAYGPDDWEQPVPSPVGMVPAHQAAEIRMADVLVHLMDLRTALGLPIDPGTEPTAVRILEDRAIRLTGWGAVKGAGLPEGARVRLDIEGRAPMDLVVADGKGRLGPPEGGPEGSADARIAGTGLAYALAVAGRPAMADAAGGLTAEGDTATALLEGYRLFL
ncbi:MAG: maleylpyruvate isomerase N-terminal domain-containing protein, partial [Actinobacteria bacterium]|nr:maleylpyruvate isomerase N-terminal domain-containing protein [Actinomycetota bacterium]